MFVLKFSNFDIQIFKRFQMQTRHILKL